MSSGRMNGINWVLEPDKFLSLQEATTLLETARVRAETARVQGHKIPVRDYFIIDLALSTGLRVMEIAQLNCGDVFIQDDIYSLLVRKGKGGKRRLVRFDGSFKRHYEEYIRWKQTVGEPTTLGDPLLSSSVTGGHMSTRAIEKAFKRIAARAGLSSHYSIHCLRHTYACQLYKASRYNLRLVQKQLGHSSIRTTEVYADVMEPDTQEALARLYK
jgi:integrase